jgi:formamidopyrimidine-DNA glycosylase
VPELPDIEVYVEALQRRVVDTRLVQITFRSPFVLRTVDPPYRATEGKWVRSVRRLGKRIVLDLEDELHVLVHLMRLGRLRWADSGKKAKNAAGKVLLGTLTFETGTLHLVEMGPKKRASVHVVRGAPALSSFDAGGLEVLQADLNTFVAVVRSENHTLKRTLTDPRLLSGIGNAYSDEILHAARLSPVKLTSKLDDEELGRLYDATCETLRTWTERLRAAVGEGWPEKVTAFHPEMAVHGRYGQPCPVCGAAVQRIVYADRETNYCAQCQTSGRPLADRALSRLLGKDWPKTMEELDERRGGS